MNISLKMNSYRYLYLNKSYKKQKMTFLINKTNVLMMIYKTGFAQNHQIGTYWSFKLN